MKLLTSLRFALCGAAIVLTHSAFVAKPPPPPPPQLENWVTVDDVQNAVNEALTVAPNGTVFAAGYGDVFDDAGVWVARAGVIRSSTDGGSTWSTTSPFMYPALSDTFYSAIGERSPRDCPECRKIVAGSVPRKR